MTVGSQARFLDGLAHLAVCQKSDQVVAIGATLRSNGNVELLVSEKGGSVQAKVVQHIQSILDSLYTIRADIQKTTTSSPPISRSCHITETADETVLSALHELEHEIIRHSLPKLLQRMVKGLEYYTLQMFTAKNRRMHRLVPGFKLVFLAISHWYEISRIKSSASC